MQVERSGCRTSEVRRQMVYTLVSMDVSKLRVYQQALKAFQLIEDIAINLPVELKDIKSQIFRSSRSVAPIIAEGYGRKRSQREFHRFIVEAMSTSDETITHLRTIALSRFNPIPMSKLKNTAEEYKAISSQLNKLSVVIKTNI